MRQGKGGCAEDTKITEDQMYLAAVLNDGTAYTLEPSSRGHRITPAAIQRWNVRHGVATVTGALRLAHGFADREGIRNVYAYVDGILRGALDPTEAPHG